MARTKQIEMVISEVQTGKITVCILGKTPILLHSLPEKAMRELLMPSGRKTTADKKNFLKHDPFQEFKDAPYCIKNPKSSTLIGHPSSAVKKSISCAALDIPGATKKELGRLLWVEDELVPLYGIPKLHMTIVRMPNQQRTPDVRTRAIIQNWASIISISYIKPNINEEAIHNLLQAAGITQGWGEWRNERGSGTYGSFEICSPEDKKFQEIIKKGGKASQIKAMAACEPYNEDTRKLLEWFLKEAKRTGLRSK
jgi:hypothetical protein